MGSTASTIFTLRKADRVISVAPTGSIPAIRDTPRSPPRSSRRSAPGRRPSWVRSPRHRRFRTSSAYIRSRRGLFVRLRRQNFADLQREMQSEPDFGIAQVDAEQVFDPAQPIEHGVAMEVQAVGRLGWTA